MRLSLCVISILSLVATSSFAAAKRGGLGIEVTPVVGYERSQKLVPTPHTHDRLLYGARLVAGFPLLSAEAEYLRGTDTEVFSSQNLTVTDTSDKGKLGLRSGVGLGPLVRIYARGGVQMTKNRHEETIGTGTPTSTETIRYDPYAGGGVRVQLGKTFALTGDVVAVFRSFPDMTQNEYQTTAGFVVKFP